MIHWFEQLPPAMVPVVVAVVASVIGALLWRLFKMALQVVAFIVFLIICAGLFAWWQPEVFGLGRRVVEGQLGPLPTADDARKHVRDRVESEARASVDETIDQKKKSLLSPTVPAEPTP